MEIIESYSQVLQHILSTYSEENNDPHSVTEYYGGNCQTCKRPLYEPSQFCSSAHADVAIFHMSRMLRDLDLPYLIKLIDASKSHICPKDLYISGKKSICSICVAFEELDQRVKVRNNR